MIDMSHCDSPKGAFGWVTANFVGGTLLRPRSEQFGALDLGGASTQVLSLSGFRVRVRVGPISN